MVQLWETLAIVTILLQMAVILAENGDKCTLDPIDVENDFRGVPLVPSEEGGRRYIPREDGMDRLYALDFRVEDFWVWPRKGVAPHLPSNRPKWVSDRPKIVPSGSLQRRHGYGIVCREFDLSGLRPSHMVGFEPQLSSFAGSDVVHHVSLYLCYGSDRGSDVVYDCDEDSPDQWCEEMVYVYDRGGGPFWLPDQVGVRIGSNKNYPLLRKPTETLVLEIHYLPALLPEEKRAPGGLLDNSGVRVWLTPDLRQWDTALLGLADETFHLAPQRESIEAPYTCPSSFFESQLGDAFDRNDGELGILAYHLHSHELGRKISLVANRGVNWKVQESVEIGKLDPFHGYGKDQSVFYSGLRGNRDQDDSLRKPSTTLLRILPDPISLKNDNPTLLTQFDNGCIHPFDLSLTTPKDIDSQNPTSPSSSPTQNIYVRPFPFKKGDSLSTTCTYNTMARSRTVNYGLGLFDEMCAPVLWIFPVNSTKPWPKNPDTEDHQGDILANLCVKG